MPRVDQLERIAPVIVDMGCFARVETNGGGFEQINLLFGENPNTSVRRWTKAFNEAGIQTQMLERGLNALRLNPAPKDLRQLMFKVKKKQGTDISRSFDGLNNTQNMALSFEYAKAGGMIAQAALSITYSPIHTVDYYINLADELIALGAEEICLKDMAGVGRPASIGRMVKGIRERHPHILIQYHGHSTPGFSVASALEAARNGADIIDVGMEPLSWGTGHADLLTIHAMLQDDGFDVPPINMKAYMQARSLTQEFIDDFLSYYIDPKNRHTNALLIGSGLPGGMMGSLMADLQKNLESLNKWLQKRGQAEMSTDELLLKLFDEVEYVWPRLGYPPLVTPYSQCVKNVALMNAINLIKGKERWELIDDNTWGLILGNSGQLPGPLGEDIIALAKKEGKEFFTGNPQDLYPDELPLFEQKMKEKGWDKGQDDEELMQYAMHPNNYEEYKSGKAKAKFLEDLEARKAAKNPKTQVAVPTAPTETAGNAQPQVMNVDVNGQSYKVTLSWGDTPAAAHPTPKSSEAPAPQAPVANTQTRDILAPLEGKFFLTKDSTEKPLKVGDSIEKGTVVGYIESMKVINSVTAEFSGTVAEIVARHGEEIEEDDVIMRIR